VGQLSKCSTDRRDPVPSAAWNSRGGARAASRVEDLSGGCRLSGVSGADQAADTADPADPASDPADPAADMEVEIHTYTYIWWKYIHIHTYTYIQIHIQLNKSKSIHIRTYTDSDQTFMQQFILKRMHISCTRACTCIQYKSIWDARRIRHIETVCIELKIGNWCFTCTTGLDKVVECNIQSFSILVHKTRRARKTHVSITQENILEPAMEQFA
jgi:hypothetical protein